MKDQKTKISKIVIEVAGHKIDLTIEQARELQEILNKTFPAEKPTVIKEIVDRWYPSPWPVWTSTDVPKFDKWEIICTGDTAGNTLQFAAR